MPVFSVIVPTHDRLELLKRTVESIRKQSFRDFEIIVVDDGSVDGTRDWLKANDNYLRGIVQPNGGPGTARNTGARAASGRYLAFLDSDDFWFPWSLQIYAEAIERCGWPAFLAGKPHVFQDEEDCKAVKSDQLRFQRFQDYLASGSEWRWWGASSFVIRKDEYTSAGGFAEGHVNSEDADLAMKLGIAPGFIQVTAPATFAYRVHASNVKSDLERTIRGTLRTLRAEQDGDYPGGRARAKERREILTRHVRPVALECLRRGIQLQAWNLYFSTFAWNASLGRFRYLLAFPIFALIEFVRRPLAALAMRRPC
jgi:glycosyltransferase involved in cell wall biosynthesis